MQAPPPDPGSCAYISLTTFRRDGRGVHTPVWVVPLDGRLYVYTEGGSGKVKRIRATKKVTWAPCDFRGGRLGKAVAGEGRLVAEPELVQRVYAALARKYGWLYRLNTALSFLSGKIRKRAVVELSPAGKGV